MRVYPVSRLFSRSGGVVSYELKEIVRNNLKEKMQRGEVASSMMVRLVRTIEIARIAKTAGFDSFYVDLEHSSITVDACAQICMAALEIGIAPLVRVPAKTPEYISRVLDGGALGIIAPHILSAEDARQVVSYAKFAPLGERSANSGLPHLQYRNFPTAAANAALNDATMVVVQIETEDALEQVDEIAAVEGVDLILVGTNDLIADMGIPGEYEHEKVRDAYARVIAACNKHGKFAGVGGLASRPQLVADFVAMGARYVSTGTDLSFLLGACTQRAKMVTDIVVPKSL
jgi:4-hydroxy-2-oxoheptanedioate aldolase